MLLIQLFLTVTSGHYQHAQPLPSTITVAPAKLYNPGVFVRNLWPVKQNMMCDRSNPSITSEALRKLRRMNCRQQRAAATHTSVPQVKTLPLCRHKLTQLVLIPQRYTVASTRAPAYATCRPNLNCHQSAYRLLLAQPASPAMTHTAY